jgi:hypothetical protein
MKLQALILFRFINNYIVARSWASANIEPNSSIFWFITWLEVVNHLTLCNDIADGRIKLYRHILVTGFGYLLAKTGYQHMMMKLFMTVCTEYCL